MSFRIPQEFREVNRSVETILRTNPRTINMAEIGEAFLQVDQRPDTDLRVQFTHSGERSTPIQDGRQNIGRISVTGRMETSMTPEPGWHVFDLMHDGTIEQGGSPVPTEEGHRELNAEQILELAHWLTERQAVFAVS